MIYQKGQAVLAAIMIGQSDTAVVRYDISEGTGCSCGNNDWSV